MPTNNINGTPFIWDAEEDGQMLGQLFAEGFIEQDVNTPPTNVFNTSTIIPISGFADSPFGPNWERTIITPNPTILQGGQSQRNELIFATFFEQNGLTVLDKYEKDPIKNEFGSFNDAATDINIYYEYGLKDKLFDPLCYVAMNKHLLHYINPNTTIDYQSPEYITTEILKAHKAGAGKATYQPITYDRLLDAITYEITVGKAGLNPFYSLAMKLLQSIANGIRGIAPTEPQWNPAHPNYDPLLGLEFITKLTNKWPSFKAKATDSIGRILNAAEWCKQNIPSLGVAIGVVLESVAAILQSLVDVIDSIVTGIGDVVKIIRLVNAFICGAITELLELAASIFDLIALLLFYATNKDGRDRLKKSIEILVTKIKEQPGVIIDELKKAYENLKARYNEDKSEYQIAYNLGSDIVAAILWVDFIVAIVKGLRNFPKLFRKLKSWADRVGTKTKVLVVNTYDKALLEGWTMLAKYFKTEKIIKSTNGAEILCFSFKKALVPVDKILMYARGKVRGVENLAALEKEFKELKNLRQNARKIFDKNPANVDRIKNLAKQIENIDKSLKNAKALEKIGILDNELGNKKLFDFVLAFINKNAGKMESGVKYYFKIAGSRGRTTGFITFLKLPNGKLYLTTIHFF